MVIIGQCAVTIYWKRWRVKNDTGRRWVSHLIGRLTRYGYDADTECREGE